MWLFLNILLILLIPERKLNTKLKWIMYPILFHVQFNQNKFHAPQPAMYQVGEEVPIWKTKYVTVFCLMRVIARFTFIKYIYKFKGI
jgi:hypothetical protein